MSNIQNEWFCHSCGNTMIPVRVPDPACSVCNSAFVEEIEDNSNDDPREFDEPDNPLDFLGGQNGAAPLLRFVAGGGAGGGGQAFVINPGAAAAAAAGAPIGGGGAGGNPLVDLMQAFGWQPPNAAPRDEGDPGDPDEEIAGGAGAGGRQDGAQARGEQPRLPLRNLATFLGEAFGGAIHPADHPRHNPFAEGYDGAHAEDEEHDHDHDHDHAHAHIHVEGNPFAAFGGMEAGGMGNYLLSLLNAFGGGGGTGDYVVGEAAFQNLLNDLMEQAAGRAGPQPAPQEKIDELPHLKVDQAMLDKDGNKDCLVCQDDFALDENILELPCHHLFHTDCLVPWLKNSGTCPTCRFALVPQPVNGVAPEQQEEAGAGADEGEQEEHGDDGAGTRGAGTGGNMSGLPGSWPTNEVEETRSDSRARDRARARAEENEALPVEDVD